MAKKEIYNRTESDEDFDWMESNEDFDPTVSKEEFPDFVQKFAEKQDREEREELKFGIIGIAVCVLFVIAVFYLCITLM